MSNAGACFSNDPPIGCSALERSRRGEKAGACTILRREFEFCGSLSGAQCIHYKTNSLIISRIIRLELVVDYQPDYQLNYQPDYEPGSTEVQAW